MRYVLAVKQPVYGAEGAFLAYQFAQALLRKGHQISQIFFFQDGVSNGNALVNPANDECNLVSGWQSLHQTYGIPLHLCIAASQRRGIADKLTALCPEHTNLAAGFTLAGLGEFSKAVLEAERVITI
ncbi:sulfurtransferase complex subunit TusD [Necropsobacter massiliensis]|uniref:sulfurtransferase complex subunit TusD n=1 Tax=Necropsobacter massiliensis TaxID=1400001 RepID=UPI000595CA10|nr:sulfurtransferase complex subunit TusD [Necropsobacter massiliensis]